MATEDVDIFEEGAADQGMYRSDGAQKSARGFIGPVKNLVTGGTMTEFSTDMQVGGRNIQIPTMVPTLSREEIGYMQRMEPGAGWDMSNPMVLTIIDKARAHARKRMSDGMSPFYQDKEGRLQNLQRFNGGGDVDVNTDQNIQMFKERLKQKGINELYSAADSLGIRLPSGIGVDSAADVIVNEIFYRTKIPIQKHKGTFTFEKKLPGGGRFGLHANPKNKSGGISLTKPFSKGGSVDDEDIFGYNLGGSISGDIRKLQGRPEPEPLTPAQSTYLAGAFADPYGAADFTGNYPEFPTSDMSIKDMASGPRAPSFIENLRQNNFGDAAFQGVGALPIPFLAGAMKYLKAGSKIGKVTLDQAEKMGYKSHIYDDEFNLSPLSENNRPSGVAKTPFNEAKKFSEFLSQQGIMHKSDTAKTGTVYITVEGGPIGKNLSGDPMAEEMTYRFGDHDTGFMSGRDNIQIRTDQKQNHKDAIDHLSELENVISIKSQDPRLLRASEQGFDTSKVYYHATDKLQDGKEFEEFVSSTKGKLGPGVYAAKRPEDTERYIRTSYQSGTETPVFDENSRILPIFVRGKMGSIEDYGRASDKAKDLLKKEFDEIDASPKNNEFNELMANRQKFALQKKKAQEILSEEGFSGFELLDQVVIFNPKNIRSVNAKFDPKEKSSANILKAEGGPVNAQMYQRGGGIDSLQMYQRGGGVRNRFQRFGQNLRGGVRNRLQSFGQNLRGGRIMAPPTPYRPDYTGPIRDSFSTLAANTLVDRTGLGMVPIIGPAAKNLVSRGVRGVGGLFKNVPGFKQVRNFLDRTSAPLVRMQEMQQGMNPMNMAAGMLNPQGSGFFKIGNKGGLLGFGLFNRGNRRGSSGPQMSPVPDAPRSAGDYFDPNYGAPKPQMSPIPTSGGSQSGRSGLLGLGLFGGNRMTLTPQQRRDKLASSGPLSPGGGLDSYGFGQALEGIRHQDMGMFLKEIDQAVKKDQPFEQINDPSGQYYQLVDKATGNVFLQGQHHPDARPTGRRMQGMGGGM